VTIFKKPFQRKGRKDAKGTEKINALFSSHLTHAVTQPPAINHIEISFAFSASLRPLRYRVFVA
jgi:hypothetical protein